MLLQNILVLGHPAAGPGQNSDSTDTVLRLTLEQSQLLAVAGDKAKLTLALRSTHDEITQTILQKSSKDLADPPPAPSQVVAKSGPVAVGSKK